MVFATRLRSSSFNHVFFAAGDKLAKFDRKLLLHKRREEFFVEINKKNAGSDTVITLIRNPSPGLALRDKVSITFYR